MAQRREREQLERTDLNISGLRAKRSRSRSRSGPKSVIGRIISGQHNIVLQWKDKFIKQKSQCETCEKETFTIRRLDPAETTWVWCALTAITSFCLLPFLIESCNDKMYFCAECLELKEETKADCCSCRCRW